MVSTQDIKYTLNGLDRVFHNEKDFQIESINQLDDSVDGLLRPEFAFDDSCSTDRDQTYVDVTCFDDKTTAIELKYPKAPFQAKASSHRFGGTTERFDLSGTGAYDMAMYPFWSDVVDLERLVDAGVVDQRYVLLLTNYKDCWTKQDSDLYGSDFLMYEGRTVSGRLEWAEGTSAQTKEDYPALEVKGTYTLNWSRYSYTYPADGEGNIEFRYTLLHVA